jgi:GT2 family glycosyltransferase
VKFENEFFDEDFFSYKEDVDLSYRLRWAGWQIWVVGGAVAYHDRNASSNEDLSLNEKVTHRKKKSKMVNYNSYKNQWYLLIKNLTWQNCLLNLPWV